MDIRPCPTPTSPGKSATISSLTGIDRDAVLDGEAELDPLLKQRIAVKDWTHQQLMAATDTDAGQAVVEHGGCL
jgi:hypothetical protein